MAEEKITTRDDGVTTEQVIERTEDAPQRVLVEKRGGGGLFIGLIILIALAVGAWFLFTQNEAEIAKDNAIAGAAEQVGEAAENVGEAAQDTGDAVQDAVND